MMESLERLTELLLHPYAVALFSLFIGCYVLRDIVRVLFFILDGSRRAGRRRPGESEEDNPPAVPEEAEDSTDRGS